MRNVIALLSFAVLAIPQDNVTFKTGVSLVHVDAEVTDPEGRIVAGLQKEDFRVFDDKKEQPILQFSAEEQPLDLILLFDISASMRSYVQEVADAAREGLRQLQQGDRVGVMVFNTRTRQIAPFTEDLDAVDKTIRQDVMGLTFGGGTHIQAAVSTAALRFLKEPRNQRRRAVLIITDNIGQKTRSEQSVVEEYWEADAILSGLLVSNPKFATIRTVSLILGPQNIARQAGMKGIAEKTGGDALKAKEPGTAFADALHRIRTRYSLYYALPAHEAGTLHAIRVELTPQAAKRVGKTQIHARTGYRVK